MKKGVIIGLVIAVVLILIVVGFFIFSNKNIEDAQVEHNQNLAMVDCGAMDNPSCMLNRMTGCLPVTGTMTATDGTTQITLTIIGVEGDKCHYQRKINNVVNMNCNFPIDAMCWDIIDQTFGNDKGFQQIVDESCKSV
jgi:hypothetical protein